MSDEIENVSSEERELTFTDLFQILLAGKYVILLLTLVTTLTAVIYANSLPNMYTAQGTFVPAVKDSGIKTGSQMSGLASLAGMQMDSSAVSNIDIAVRLITSTKFLMDFLERRQALNELGQLGGWNISEEDWNSKEVEEKQTFLHQASGLLRQHIVVDHYKRTEGFIVISVHHRSPEIAKKWVEGLVEDLNKMMMTEDVLEAKKSIEYLTLQASKTSVADLRMLFYAMIQGHVKTTTLAAVREEYVFKTLDPALAPLGPSGPDRDSITIWGMLGGIILSFTLVLLSHFFGYEFRGLKINN